MGHIHVVFVNVTILRDLNMVAWQELELQDQLLTDLSLSFHLLKHPQRSSTMMRAELHLRRPRTTRVTREAQAALTIFTIQRLMRQR
jgi:hypothetical protein